MKRILVCCLFILGCGRPVASTSQLQDLAYNSRAKNVAMLIGASNGLGGVKTDIYAMRDLLQDTREGFHFDVDGYMEASTADAMKAIQEGAAAVDDQGTLLLYFSGHGTEEGEYVTTDGLLPLSSVWKAIAAGRSRPVKRLIVIIDACFSGTWVNAIAGGGGRTEPQMVRAQEYSSDDLGKFNHQMTKAFRSGDKGQLGLYNEILTMSAARSTESASDLGSSKGGAFTYYFRTAVADLWKNAQNATFADLVNETTDQTSSNKKHVPQTFALPKTMLQQKLFGENGTATQSPPAQQQPTPVVPVVSTPTNPGNLWTLGETLAQKLTDDFTDAACRAQITSARYLNGSLAQLTFSIQAGKMKSSFAINTRPSLEEAYPAVMRAAQSVEPSCW